MSAPHEPYEPYEPCEPYEEARDRALYELPTNTVVSAGAGTGKTHRLTGLYLHLIGGLTDVGGALSPEAIVATTFTREAAGEMRARIERRLRRLAGASLDTIVEAGGDDAAWALELRRTCARRGVPHPERGVWAGALEGLPRAVVTTFHAWAGEIVRGWPIEARVPPGFTLMEPEEADELVARATNEVVARWIDDESEAASGRRRCDAVRNFLSSGVGILEKATTAALARAHEEGAALSTLSLADDDVACEAARVRLRALLRTIDAIEPIGAPPTKGAGTRPEVEARVAAACELGEQIEREGATIARVEAFGEAVKAIHGSMSAACWASARTSLDGALPVVRKASDGVVVRACAIAEAPDVTRAAATLSAAARGFLVEVDRVSVAARRRVRALDFADVLRTARNLLRDNPDVQAEVARDVRALLVDEFQDTNALQRDLVYLVRQRPEDIARRAAGDLADPRTLQPTGLFLVGDRKQSIYGFRGADVGVFQRMACDLAGDEAHALLGVARSSSARGDSGSGGALVSLETNRRSVDEILRFVNAVAEVDLRGAPELAPIERVVFHAPSERLRAVRSSGRPADAPNARVVVPVVELPNGGAALRDDLSGDLVAALALAAEIRALLSDPSRLDLPRDRPIRARDVAILIRTYAILPALEFALALHGVEYAVAAGRGLYSTVEAGDVEAFVRLVIDPTDRHALLAVLRGPWVALTDRALLALCGPHGIELPTAPAAPAAPTAPTAPTAMELAERSPGAIDGGIDDAERARLARVVGVLDDLRRHGPHLGAAAALRRAIDVLGVERTLAMLPSGEARIGDLRKLVEIAERFPAGLAHFARHLARARQVDLEERRGATFDRDDDAVRVMTIHAAKGLEFPVVAVMQLEHLPRPDSAPFLVRRTDDALAIAARLEVGSGRAWGEGGRTLLARATAAERAERQRLTYVALTRARDALYLVAGARKKGRPFRENTAGRAIAAAIDGQPRLAVQPTWQPSLSVPSTPSSSQMGGLVGGLMGGRDDQLAPPEAAFGEGDIPITTAGNLVVTTALADFDGCPRRFRLLHTVGLPEHPPRTRALARHAGDGVVELANPGVARVALAAIEAAEPELADRADVDAGAEAEHHAALPVVPLPVDPRSLGVLTHLALERAPIPAALGRGAVGWASSFLRGEGFDPSSEVGARVMARIVAFLDGRYAATLPQVEVRREVPFLVRLPSGADLRGTIDLLVTRRRGDGSARIEVVDYKSASGSRADLTRYDLQLRAYAAAVLLGGVTREGAHSWDGAAIDVSACEVVAGVVFLGGAAADGEPRWLDGGRDLAGARTAELVASIDAVARRLLEARARSRFPPVERARCDALQCGFRPLCHGE